MQRVQQENINLPAGVVQVGKSEYLVRASALLQSAQETGELVVTTKNGAPIRLNQVANVTDSILEQRTFQRLNGMPAVGMTINAQPNSNIVANVGRRIQKNRARSNNAIRACTSASCSISKDSSARPSLHSSTPPSTAQS